jgi:hypothetical protein
MYVNETEDVREQGIFGLTGKEVTGGWRKLREEKLCNFCGRCG